MKTALIFSMLLSLPAMALTDGQLINKDFNDGDPSMFKSLIIDQSKCEKGGAIVKFYGADAMNFCIGNESKSVFTYKKCIGKEINQFPIKACVGIKRNADLITIKSVSKNQEGTIILKETNSDDGKLYFEQSYSIDEQENGDLKITQSFQDHRDGRHGSNEIIFSKK